MNNEVPSIINADDFGMSTSNDCTIQLLGDKKINFISVMVNRMLHCEERKVQVCLF